MKDGRYQEHRTAGHGREGACNSVLQDLASVEIAGVNFLLGCRAPVAVESPFAVYQPFFGKRTRDPWAVDIRVTVELEPFPDTDSLPLFFDSGETWRLFRDGPGYVLRYEPFWVARISEDASDVTVHLGPDHIRKHDDGKVTITSPISYPLDQFLLVYALAQRSGILMHAACVSVGRSGYIFPGRSRAGKSTLTGIFAGAGGMEPLSDDRIVVRKIGDGLRAFGTPWPGEGGIAVNRGTDLAAMLFIVHGNDNRIRPLAPRAALERLLPVASIPWYNTAMLGPLLGLCEELVGRVPSYEFAFRPDASAADAVKEFAGEAA